MQYEYLTNCLGIQEYRVVDVERTTRKEQSAVIVYLERTRREYRCSGCGALLRTAYDGIQQEVQHLMLWLFWNVCIGIPSKPSIK
jgi:hypothetical protein